MIFILVENRSEEPWLWDRNNMPTRLPRPFDFSKGSFESCSMTALGTYFVSGGIRELPGPIFASRRFRLGKIGVSAAWQISKTLIAWSSWDSHSGLQAFAPFSGSSAEIFKINATKSNPSNRFRTGLFLHVRRSEHCLFRHARAQICDFEIVDTISKPAQQVFLGGTSSQTLA